MEITRITQQNIHAFQQILPPHKSHQTIWMFGCVENDTAIGTAVLRSTEDEYSLSWLWVAPEYRLTGAGGALLDEVCRIAAQTPEKRLVVTYPADALWGSMMEHMLVNRGFCVLVHTYPRYCFSRDNLLTAPFLTNAKPAEYTGVIPVSELSRLQIRKLIAENIKRKNYVVNQTDFERSDGQRSMALVRRGSILGLLLVSTAEAEDILNLDLLYLKKTARTSALMLIRQAALTALNHPAGLREVRFLCTEEASERLCRRLIGEQTPTPTKYCRGTLYAGFYRERGDRYE